MTDSELCKCTQKRDCTIDKSSAKKDFIQFCKRRDMNKKNIIDTLRPGTNPPNEVNVVIEIPKGSDIKYEIDPKSGGISVDRILFPAMFYPFNYGFIPQTREEDGDDGGADPIDVFILGNYSLLPKSVISCRPIGILLSEDQGGIDSKIIGVPLTNIDISTILDIEDVPENMRMQLKHFIEHHKDLEEGKYVKITGWQGKNAAVRRLSEAIERYNDINLG
jgi:inorganic pyrophosphatase